MRAVLPVDGGNVTVNGRSANVLGVSPQAFRPWTPLSTAGSAAVWSDLSQGKLVSTAAAARKLHLSAGDSYQVSAATDEQVPFGGPTALSIPGADAVVNLTQSAQRHVGVDRRGPDTMMAQERLDHPRVDSRFQQVRRIAMSQCVRRHPRQPRP